MQPPQLEFVTHVSAEIAAPITSGQSPRGRLYFRTIPRFETSDESLRWLMRSLFVATAAPRDGKVELDFFRVL